MYFILAVSEQHIYGTIASNKANNANVFIYFLSELIKNRNKSFKDENSKTCFIIENASIHKTTEAKNFAKRRSIHLLTIPSYSPALNGAETVIQAIKSKVKQRRCEGK